MACATDVMLIINILLAALTLYGTIIAMSTQKLRVGEVVPYHATLLIPDTAVAPSQDAIRTRISSKVELSKEKAFQL